MLKKTITYNDLDGKTITEDFYFNLSKSEITKMELLQGEGGLSGYLKRIVEANDGAKIMSTFEEIISKSYGLRGADNKRFEKSPEISKHFMQTGAYDQLFMELVTDADASSAFVRAIVPESLADDLDPGNPVVKNVTLPVELKSVQHNEPINKEVTEMTREELLEALKNRSTEPSKNTVQDR